MDARLDLFASPIASRVARHLVSAGKVLADSTLPPATREPVKLRAGQINGCGFCTDMHSKDALLCKGRDREHRRRTQGRAAPLGRWRAFTARTGRCAILRHRPKTSPWPSGTSPTDGP
ncbi:carboxymuconolactone decarboxylase family protein [Streptomyces melanogenes]|uniref:carboxymuconolactone decarboxylase family protein n=1 Tax=Streptomyces melanogenes TaxID=67326 RepID=UPI003789E85B